MTFSFDYFFKNIRDDELEKYGFKNCSCEFKYNSYLGCKIVPPYVDKYYRNSLWNRNLLMTKGRAKLPPYDVSIEFIIQEFKVKDIMKSNLFILRNDPFCGFEIEDSIDPGCTLCGSGKIIYDNPTIDERTIISKNFGHTNTGRFVVSAEIYYDLLEQGFYGFTGKNLKSSYDLDCYILFFNGGGHHFSEYMMKNHSIILQKMDTYIKEYSYHYYILHKDLYESDEFYEIRDYMKYMDKKDISMVTLFKPGRSFENMPKCRWVELVVTGKAGVEEPYNEYYEEGLCPVCNDNVWCPKGQMNLDYSQWDGSDFSKTEKGKIIISKRAYSFMKKYYEDIAEPIADINAPEKRSENGKHHGNAVR